MKDKMINKLIKKEKKRKSNTLNLIASENVAYPEVLDCLGSVLTDKYSEGLPGNRYYTGNVYIDAIENLCISRALDLYNLSKDNWGVNVQAYSGSIANLAVYNALMDPGDVFMGLSLTSGGHLTHGFFTEKRKVSISSVIYNSKPYSLDNGEVVLDYEALESKMAIHKPKLLITGGSSYCKDFDFGKLKEMCDKFNTYLMYDMSHTCALVSVGLMNYPFYYCDIVTTTTHKSLRGPRGALIFSQKKLNSKINRSVFPGIQGGPHNNNIAGIAVTLYNAKKPEFKMYCRNTLEWSNKLIILLHKNGVQTWCNSTANGIILLNVGKNAKDIAGNFERYGVDLNSNSLPFDSDGFNVSGLRLGLAGCIARGLKHTDIPVICDIIVSILYHKKSDKDIKKMVKGIVSHLK